MTLRQLAARNIKGSSHRYLAFFLSSVFSVLVFYLFASFIYHPGVVSGHIEQAARVRRGMLACEYIIMIFSFFFILYSTSAFLRSRQKEFGLMLLLGMTRRQVRRLVLTENTLIAVLSILSGMGLGTLFSKLFFMAMSELLEVTNPIPFQLVPKAIVVTAAGFLAIFEAITLFSLARTGRSELIQLLKEARMPKLPPHFSKWLTLLSIACLGAGYWMAATATMMNFVARTLPILFLVILGTYFLFTQASVAMLGRMQRRLALYYRRTNMITISQLVFRIRDNAQILFMVSILSAVVLTASGTMYVFYEHGKTQIVQRLPQTFAFTERRLDAHEVLEPSKVEDVLRQDRIGIDYKVRIVGLSTEVNTGMSQRVSAPQAALVISEDDYNALAGKVADVRRLEVHEGHTVYVNPSRGLRATLIEKGDVMDLEIGGRRVALEMDGQHAGAVINPVRGAYALLVIDSGEYAELMSEVPDQAKIVYYGYELKNWEWTNETVQRIRGLVPSENRVYFSERVSAYVGTKQVASLTLFIGLFISLLFFIAAGSLIYFKLLTELQDDRAQYKSLSRIGVSRPEMRRVISTQINMVFFIPFAVGSVHAAFAMKMLSNVLAANLWRYGAVVAAIFLAMQIIYSSATRAAYMRQISEAALA